MPSSSEATCRIAVMMRWPCDGSAAATVSAPVVSRRRVTASRPGCSSVPGPTAVLVPSPVSSAKQATPTPRSLPFGRRGALVGALLLIVGLGHRQLQARHVVDVVVHQVVGVAIGHRLRRDEIALADLDRIELEPARHLVDQQLQRARRRRPADRAVGTDRRLVGGDAARAVAHRRHPIGPGHQARGLQRLHAGRPQIGRVGADIDPDVGARARGYGRPCRPQARPRSTGRAHGSRPPCSRSGPRPTSPAGAG